jgi:hypothetical protein
MVNYIDDNVFVVEKEEVLGMEYMTMTLYRNKVKVAMTTKQCSGNEHKDRLEAQTALLGSCNPNKLPITKYNT